jgi:hypothetical protein
VVAVTETGGEEMTLTDIAWIFTAIIFSVVAGCVVWIIKEERRK